MKAEIDITDPDRIAQMAQMAMLLELSSSPKPGNVDRCHDYEDMSFSHFVASAVLSYPSFRRAASGASNMGRLILDTVSTWREWGLRGNTHFGEIALLIPLASAASRPGPLRSEIYRVLESTTVEDSICFYRAFELAGARAADVKEMSLKDPKALEEIEARSMRLIDLMRISQGHDLIAREWATGFSRSFELADALCEMVPRHGLNRGVVITYLTALSGEPDSLVASKFGIDVALEVSRMASVALRSHDVISSAMEMDRALISRDINPGSTADLIASSLFIALMRGLRF
ncbi:triphosphoribosyl-dephospho-CoA synthase [Methanothrix sp.]|jgi:triphosphoribosyl-dephospho-CoA synthase|uniref:Triphosphoribosyl-dephospho-CoA protein n=2 Tax=Methanothrix TaxID=2222 RepID=A0B783_METTP|nr:triphosphoribosyl-dephospho-CoA synthase [Methanothrix sp.]ABK14557.1 triphosphoribosyl-dephospho-CoA protein [Methanothrix thermoacetophila PT]